ncbi:hypothetical protein TWF506_008076 [Arthrobotrys conoides]|uniref:Uncharacterized protein n=1 Tax=Arthrobotrys conoides TaxID=74498 RepID=A0AAN8NMP6_9PEZI
MVSSSTPSDSLRLRQKLSITESLSGARSIRSNRSNPSQPPLSKRPSLANSMTGSMRGSITGSQRNRLREYRAEAIFNQTTPSSTIRLIMSRASEAPNAPAAPHLFHQLMEYFGADEDQIKAVIDGQQQQNFATDSAGGDTVGVATGVVQQENSIPGTPTGPSSTAGVFYPAHLRTNSGASTPGSEPIGDLSTRQLSNAEIMLYINTMLGNFPGRRRPGNVKELEQMFVSKYFDEQQEEGSEYGYVSDCEPCDIDSLSGDDEASKKAGEGGAEDGVGELKNGVEGLRISGAMREIKECTDYDAL